jgi:hypothetical protein
MKHPVKLFPAYTGEKKLEIVVSPSFSRRLNVSSNDFKNNFSFIIEVASRRNCFSRYFRRR